MVSAKIEKMIKALMKEARAANYIFVVTVSDATDGDTHSGIGGTPDELLCVIEEVKDKITELVDGEESCDGKCEQCSGDSHDKPRKKEGLN
jgi:hypothetical protein